MNRAASVGNNLRPSSRRLLTEKVWPGNMDLDRPAESHRFNQQVQIELEMDPSARNSYPALLRQSIAFGEVRMRVDESTDRAPPRSMFSILMLRPRVRLACSTTQDGG